MLDNVLTFIGIASLVLVCIFVAALAMTGVVAIWAPEQWYWLLQKIAATCGIGAAFFCLLLGVAAQLGG